MKLFNTIAYHSTSQKGLKKFKNTTTKDKAFTGEGAQIHGWGLYLQQDKELNIERYKNMYGNYYTHHCDCEIDIGRKSYYSLGWFNGWIDKDNKDSDKISFMALTLIRKYGSVTNAISKLDSDKTFSWNWEKPERKEKVLKLLQKWLGMTVLIKEGNQQIETGGGVQYTVEFPDNFVFIDEDKTLNTSDSNIDSLMKEFQINLPYTEEDLNNEKQKLIKHLLLVWNNYPQYDEKYWNECLDYWRHITSSGDRDIDYASYQFSRKYRGFGDRLFEDILQSGYGFICNVITRNGSGRKLYETVSDKLGGNKQASEYLYNHGINGIRYNGDTDGLCYVIFNCKDLKIIKEE